MLEFETQQYKQILSNVNTNEFIHCNIMWFSQKHSHSNRLGVLAESSACSVKCTMQTAALKCMLLLVWTVRMGEVERCDSDGSNKR